MLRTYVLYFARVKKYTTRRDPNDDKVAVSWQKGFDRGVALVGHPNPDSAVGECAFG
jgi:hypothetical protein